MIRLSGINWIILIKFKQIQFHMKRKKGAYIIMVISIILIIANFLHAYPDEFDLGFFLRTISSILLLISMVISVNHKKNEDLNY